MLVDRNLKVFRRRSLVLTSAGRNLFRDSGLFQHRVGGVQGQDLMVYGKTPLRDRAVPDFMVSFARPVKVA